MTSELDKILRELEKEVGSYPQECDQDEDDVFNHTRFRAVSPEHMHYGRFGSNGSQVPPLERSRKDSSGSISPTTFERPNPPFFPRHGNHASHDSINSILSSVESLAAEIEKLDTASNHNDDIFQSPIHPPPTYPLPSPPSSTPSSAHSSVTGSLRPARPSGHTVGRKGTNSPRHTPPSLPLSRSPPLRSTSPLASPPFLPNLTGMGLGMGTSIPMSTSRSTSPASRGRKAGPRPARKGSSSRDFLPGSDSGCESDHSGDDSSDQDIVAAASTRRRHPHRRHRSNADSDSNEDDNARGHVRPHNTLRQNQNAPSTSALDESALRRHQHQQPHVTSGSSSFASSAYPSVPSTATPASILPTSNSSPTRSRSDSVSKALAHKQSESRLRAAAASPQPEGGILAIVNADARIGGNTSMGRRRGAEVAAVANGEIANSGSETEAERRQRERARQLASEMLEMGGGLGHSEKSLAREKERKERQERVERERERERDKFEKAERNKERQERADRADRERQERAEKERRERERQERSEKERERERERNQREREKERARVQEEDPKNISSEKASNDDRIRAAIAKLQDASIQRVTTRIYINDARNFKTMQLTSLMSTAHIIQLLKKKGMLDDEDDWALFELANDYGVERPLREWEIVTDVVQTWEPEKNNALLAKKYAYKMSLTSESVINNAYPKLYGWLHHEYKRNKWHKRFFYVKDNALYHAKDAKYTGETLLCGLGQYDVYTLTRILKKAPTKFQFALKSQDRARFFENPDNDYLHFLCADHLEKMKDWVLSIRNARSQIHYDRNPERVMNPLAPIDPPTIPQTIIESTLLSMEVPRAPNDHKIMRRPPSPPQEYASRGPNAELVAPISSVLVPPRPKTNRNTNRSLEQKGEASDDERMVNVRRDHSRMASPQPLENPREDAPMSLNPATSTSTSRRQEQKVANDSLSQAEVGGSPQSASRTLPQGSNRPKVVIPAQRGPPPTGRLPSKPGESPTSITSPTTLIQIDDQVNFEKGSLLSKGSLGHSRNGSRGGIEGRSRSDSRGGVEGRSRSDSRGGVEGRSRSDSQGGGRPSPLVRIEDEVKFAKGSLLAKGSASNISAPRPQNRDREPDAALASFGSPRSAPPLPAAVLQRKESQRIREPANPPLPPPGGLLQLDPTREQAHTQNLVDRQMKPLVMFDREMVDPAAVERQRQEQRKEALAKQVRDAREMRQPLYTFDEFDRGKLAEEKSPVGKEWKDVIG